MVFFNTNTMKIIYKVEPFHKDERGEMCHLLPKEVKITSAVLITSKKGSIRANHYHKKDTHYCYMIKGKMEYSYQDFANAKKKKTVIVEKGDVVITHPMTLHAMKFLEDSMFLALTTEKRDQKKYERDTVRVTLIQ